MSTPWKDEVEAAEYVRRGVSTLQKLRCYGGGPRYSKRGRSVVYHVDWLDEWLASAAIASTSEQAAA